MKRVLFVCVHNAGRSQMAKALFNRMARESESALRAESAGTAPAGHVHENVVAVMREVGIELSAERPRLLTNEMVENAKRVVTMGCAVDSESCPAIFLRNVEDWGLPDPKDKPPEAVRQIRDEIERRVRLLLSEMQSE